MADSPQQQRYTPWVMKYTNEDNAKTESFKIYRPHSKYLICWAYAIKSKSAVATALMLTGAMFLDVLHYRLQDIAFALGMEHTNGNGDDGTPAPDPFADSPADGTTEE